jgi:hypothetical protein
MDEVDLQTGLAKALDALLADRLALLCGAGLSMAPPSSVPSAAALAWEAKQKYDATFGTGRPPLAETIDDQAEFFFAHGQLETVYLRTYIDYHTFAVEVNIGHVAVADLLLTRAISTVVSTNVDRLIETAGSKLFGEVGAGVSRARVAALAPNISPLLKIHGCWSDPSNTVWAVSQLAADPIKTRIEECSDWLINRLLDRDLVIVGFCTDWDYLNQVLEVSLGAVCPARVIVIDPCETATFEEKAPELFALGQRASSEFLHIRISGDEFLNKLRVEFSRTYIRRVLSAGVKTYSDQVGTAVDDTWLEPHSSDADILWCIRRDLEGCNPNEPAKGREPIEEPLLGMTLLQIQARGAVADGSYWNLNGQRMRVLRAANRPLYEVENAFSRETAPVVAPDYVIAVGAEALPLPPSIARGGGSGSIARGTSSRWLSRTEAVTKFQL